MMLLKNLLTARVSFLFASLFSLTVSTAVTVSTASAAEGGRRFDRADSDKRYLHHIDLYDSKNRKITPDSDQPYSPQNTCGRCHDYDTISHGWHFNAFRNHNLRMAAKEVPKDISQADGEDVSTENTSKPDDGRPGEPWIWSDERTGTQLPLSYRDWPGRFNPVDVGISDLEMTRYFGARLPGGGAGSAEERGQASGLPAPAPESDPEPAPESGQTADTKNATDLSAARWQLTGDLEVDCMVCHAVSGAYDFEKRRDTIASENFAWAPTSALRLGEIDGAVARIKEGSDPSDPGVQSKLPKVQYDARRFNPDGTVFMDLVRGVENNACYQCHSQRTVTRTEAGTVAIDERFIHDQDVHIRAGMNCTDCHRNGIDHQITRGFEGEKAPQASDASMTTLSCTGCHLGTDFYLDEEDAERSLTQREIANRPGRLGSPLPLHPGLPPVHFEKLTCTACHSGPAPKATAAGLMTSLAHGLGEKGHRTGEELPAIHGPLFVPENATGSTLDPGDPRATVARGMWPAYWGEIRDGNVRPLSPEKVYAATRKALRVRRGFIEEIARPELSSKEIVTLLGEERGKVSPEQRTPQEHEKLAALRSENGQKLFDEKVAAALEAIATELAVQRPVYVATGTVFALADSDSEPSEGAAKLQEISVDNPEAINLIHWPMAHNVRPAGWSLGATGCLECHADDGLIFASTVTTSGPAAKPGVTLSMAELQRIPEADWLLWNQMFVGRSAYKAMVIVSLSVLALVLLLGIVTGVGRTLSKRSDIQSGASATTASASTTSTTLAPTTTGEVS